MVRFDSYRQPKRLNGFESEAEFSAGLSLFERGYPKPAGPDALGQLCLGEASGLAPFAHQRAKDCGVDGLGHGSVIKSVNNA